MSTETPEQVAITPPTPENVAAALTWGDHEFDEALGGWPGITAEGNVVHIKIEPAKETSWGCEADPDNASRFEAHVFKVEPPTPVAAEPVELDAETARELAYSDLGDTVDGWTVAANDHIDNARWESIHRLVIRNEAGQHFADTYRQGLTESQDTGPWEYEDVATFEPVERRVKVVQSYEWVTPAAQVEQSPTGGDRDA